MKVDMDTLTDPHHERQLLLLKAQLNDPDIKAQRARDPRYDALCCKKALEFGLEEEAKPLFKP